MKRSEIYQLASDCLVEDMDGELLVYKPATATTSHLNGSSAIILQLCTGQRSVQDIINALQLAYPEQTNDIPGDVVSALSRMIDGGILEQIAD